MSSKKTKNKGGRPTRLNDLVLKKLEESLKVGSSISQACIYAGISQQDYFNRIKKHKWFFERMEDFKNFPFIFAKEAVFKAINSKDTALSAKYAIEFLKRRDPERKDKSENINFNNNSEQLNEQDQEILNNIRDKLNDGK